MKLLDEIRKILLENRDNDCGGLFAAEIEKELRKRGIEASSVKIANLIRRRGKNIKIHPIQYTEGRFINLYYADPLPKNEVP